MTVTAGGRPFPLPDRSWLMAQRWERPLFLHWRIERAALRPHVPAGLDIQERDGSAWVSIVPLHMAHMHLRWLPPVVHLSHFGEINVRTYVAHHGRPGVFFLRILAANRICSLIGRWVFDSPYEDAPVSCNETGGEVVAQGGAGNRRLRAAYRPTGDRWTPAAGSLDLFLAERYAMYVVRRRGGLAMGEVAHSPWELRAAEVDLAENSLLRGIGLPLDGPPDRVFCAESTESHVWSLRRVD